MAMISALITFALLGGALAQFSSLGGCPELQTALNLDLNKYMGRWYELQQYSMVSESGIKCVMSEFSHRENNTFNMVHTTIWMDPIQPTTKNEVARVPDPSNPAKLKIRSPNYPFGIEMDYWILGTDHDNYAVVYHCLKMKLINVNDLSILTRQPNPPQAVIDQAIKVVKANNLNISRFTTNNQMCE